MRRWHCVGETAGFDSYFIFLSREVWPTDQFGASDIDEEGEFMCLSDIFKMDMPGNTLDKQINK